MYENLVKSINKFLDKGGPGSGRRKKHGVEAVRGSSDIKVKRLWDTYNQEKSKKYDPLLAKLTSLKSRAFGKGEKGLEDEIQKVGDKLNKEEMKLRPFADAWRNKFNEKVYK